MRTIIAIMLWTVACAVNAGHSETAVQLETKTGTLSGSLLVPDATDSIPVALLIAGSGPTDRDGNNPSMKNNSLKMLAGVLCNHGIASLRYDKRGILKSRKAGLKETDLRFEHYVSDATDWIRQLNKDKRFSEVVVIGHSEGSLIGMIAAQDGGVAKFVSVAGPGKSADKLLKEQLQSQPEEVQKVAFHIIDNLVQGKTVKDVQPMYHTLFRPSFQPYLISWFNYDPAEEIAKLDIPVLIVQGTTDIQVSEKDARILAKANPRSTLRIIEGMNHVLKKVEADRMKNLATYNQPTRPIMPELVTAITSFIKKSDASH